MTDDRPWLRLYDDGTPAAGSFPGEAQTVRMDDAVLDEALGRGASDQPNGTTAPAGGIPLDRDL